MNRKMSFLSKTCIEQFAYFGDDDYEGLPQLLTCNISFNNLQKFLQPLLKLNTRTEPSAVTPMLRVLSRYQYSHRQLKAVIQVYITSSKPQISASQKRGAKRTSHITFSTSSNEGDASSSMAITSTSLQLVDPLNRTR